MNTVRTSISSGKVLKLLPLLGEETVVNAHKPTVRNAGEHILRAVRDGGSNSILRIDATGIALGASVIAQLLAPVLEQIVKGEIEDRYIAVYDPSGENEWEADAALKRQSEEGSKLICVWAQSEGRPKLVGSVDKQVQHTYNFVWECMVANRVSTAREMAEANGLTIQAASNRLSKANELGVIIVESVDPIAGGGVQKIYRPVQ